MAISSQFLARREHRRLDAARIAQALQNELIGGGGALLALLDLGQIAIDGDGTAAASVRRSLTWSQRPSERAEASARQDCDAGKTLPRSTAPSRRFGVLNETVRDGAADDLFEGGAGFRRARLPWSKQFGDICVLPRTSRSSLS